MIHLVLDPFAVMLLSNHGFGLEIGVRPTLPSHNIVSLRCWHSPKYLDTKGMGGEDFAITSSRS